MRSSRLSLAPTSGGLQRPSRTYLHLRFMVNSCLHSRCPSWRSGRVDAYLVLSHQQEAGLVVAFAPPHLSPRRLRQTSYRNSSPFSRLILRLRYTANPRDHSLHVTACYSFGKKRTKCLQQTDLFLAQELFSSFASASAVTGCTSCKPEARRIAFSMVRHRDGFSRNTCLAFSRPWANRSSP
jgi:hypothetical protein